MRCPALWVAGILFGAFLLWSFFSGESRERRFYSMDPLFQGRQEIPGTARGLLVRREDKANSCFLYLKKVSVACSETNTVYHFSDFLVILGKGDTSLQPGSLLEASGSVAPFETPTNPGQFHEKNYYREKGIYYKIFAKQCQAIQGKTSPVLRLLYQAREKLRQVYSQCLSDREAGILSAMLLGDKSALDMKVRELYQAAGISHLLAISGLHISILAFALYRGLKGCRLPGTLPFLLTSCFLFAYGQMTGFGISTQRAVIMALLSLLAGEWRRSYDALSAMGVSAAVIFLRKPDAILSVSFLLSYGAAAGIYLIQPALQHLLWGPEDARKILSDRKRRKKRELMERGWEGRVLLLLGELRENLASSLLCSISIWVATLPILCYFFNEIPVYGILANLIVLPLAAPLVVTAMAGGVLGAVSLPLGKGILLVPRAILTLYRNCCLLLQKFPHPIHITGRPPTWKILVFCLAAALVCTALLRKKTARRSRKECPDGRKGILICCLAASIVLLLWPAGVKGFSCTVLDVGQGDGIVCRTESGETILVDGGSTSVSQVGRYRILPFLKYSGIHRIDYMIMTHEDEDHISGQMELLETGRENGISLGCLLLPEPAASSQGDNYRQMQRLAEKAGVPWRTLHRGDTLRLGKLEIHCLHPEKGFVPDSANAYSTVLEVQYGQRTLLLTGDLEKNGEEAVMESAEECDILKVAHHGSRNSTSEKFLEKVRPQIAVISCGQGNRYGHPHRELLHRLESYTGKICRTDVQGAVFLYTRGKSWQIASYGGG